MTHIEDLTVGEKLRICAETPNVEMCFTREEFRFVVRAVEREEDRIRDQVSARIMVASPPQKAKKTINMWGGWVAFVALAGWLWWQA